MNIYRNEKQAKGLSEQRKKGGDHNILLQQNCWAMYWFGSLSRQVLVGVLTTMWKLEIKQSRQGGSNYWHSMMILLNIKEIAVVRWHHSRLNTCFKHIVVSFGLESTINVIGKWMSQNKQTNTKPWFNNVKKMDLNIQKYVYVCLRVYL